MPGTILGTRDKVVKKANNIPALISLYILVGQRERKVKKQLSTWMNKIT